MGRVRRHPARHPPPQRLLTYGPLADTGDPGGYLDAGVEAELGKDALHVAFGGPLRDHQLGGDLLVAAASGDQAGHLQFPARERRGAAFG
jgi:hypothetical protein